MTGLFFSVPAFAKPNSKAPTYFEYREKICEQARKEMCKTQNISKNLMDLANLSLVQSCNDYYKTNHCEDVKFSLLEKDRDLLLSCKSEAICKDETTLDLVKCSIDGGKTQFEISALALNAGVATGATLAGLSGSIVTVAMLPILIYGTSKEAAACDADINHKMIMIKMHNLSLLPNENILDPLDKNKDVLKMPCDDLKKFLQIRLEVMASKREKNATLSPLAEELLKSLKSNRCYNPQLVKERLCQSIASFVVGSAIGGIAGGVTKKALTAKGLEKTEIASENTVKTSKAPKNAVEARLPGVNRDTFSADVKERRRIWNETNPQNKNNYSVPEHKDGIDFIKKSLVELKDAKPTSKMLDAEKRSQDVDALLKEIETLEKNSYPNLDSLNLAHRASYLLDSIDRKYIHLHELKYDLLNRFNYKSNISKNDSERISNLLGKIYDARLENSQLASKVEAYDKELIKIFQADVDKQNLKIDIAKELKRLRNQNEDERIRPVSYQSDQERLQKNDFVITARDLDVRSIGEATLYDIHVAGVINKKVKVDGIDNMEPSQFLEHDFGHAELASKSYSSVMLRSLPNSEKQQILNRIDSIQNSKEKGLAEFSLMATLREGSVFNKNTLPSEIQEQYKNVVGKKISEKDASWMIKWASENLTAKVP